MEDVEPSRPRILLEVLSPAGTRLVFFLLYGAFAFAIWLGRVSRLEESAKKTCVAHATTMNETVSWRGELTNLGELFGSVALEARLPNGTNATTETLGYYLRVRASPKKKPHRRWQDVLMETDATTVRASDPDFDRSAVIQEVLPVTRSARLASWYQNMEAPPSRSRVHSYSVTVDFCCPATDWIDPGQERTECPLVTPDLRSALEMGGELHVAYDDVSRLGTFGAKLARIAVVAAWVAIAIAWLPQALFKRRDADQRRKAGRSPNATGLGGGGGGGVWTPQDIVADENDKAGFSRLFLLLISLLLYIDPLDCCVQIAPTKADIPPVVAFLSFASRRFGEAGLLAALLLMADGDGTAADRIRRCFELTKIQQQKNGSSTPARVTFQEPTREDDDDDQGGGYYKAPPLNQTLPSEVDGGEPDDVATDDDTSERHVSVVRVARRRIQEHRDGARPSPSFDSDLDDLLGFFEEQQHQHRKGDRSWFPRLRPDDDDEKMDLLENPSEVSISSEGDDSMMEEWRRHRHRRRFDRYKRMVVKHWWLVFPGLYVFCSVYALGLRFPSLWNLKRPPTLALASWPTSALMQFVGSSLVVVVAVVAWAVLFVGLLWRAARRLEAAPYLLTRRHQLAYRFFVLQSFLVAGVAIASYAALTVKLVSRYHQSIATATGTATSKHSRRAALRDLASALEALVADDVRDLASAFFFCIYVALICYLNLPPPPDAFTKNGASAARSAVLNYYGDDYAAFTYLRRFLPHAANAAVDRARHEIAAASDLGLALVGNARFVMTELADAKRRKAWRRAVRDLAATRAVPPELATPPDFFVVDTARWLVRVAAEAYFDCSVKANVIWKKAVPSSEEVSVDAKEEDPRPRDPLTGGSAGTGDASRIGLEAVAEIHVEDDDTYAVVFRHVRKPWVVIAFRGSASLKHWYTNLRITQHQLSLHDDKPAVYAEREAARRSEIAAPQTPTMSQSQRRPVSSAKFSDEEDDYFFDDEDFDDDDFDTPDAALATTPLGGSDDGPRESSETGCDPIHSGTQPTGANRVVVDTMMRYMALLVGAVERTFGLVLRGAEAAGREMGAAHIPGVDRLVLPCVHSGFWTAYSGVRDDLHRVVLDACDDHRPISRIIVTGHSLGGALATVAAADLAAHLIPSVQSAPRFIFVTF